MELNELISSVNDAVWGYVLIAALVSCGLWFTWRTRFVQFRMVGEMIRLLTDSAIDTVETQVKENAAGERSKHISSFQAFAVSVATRVGTGNLAGVASAIAIGGPGAVFWMWVIALIGSATAFVESTLAQLFCLTTLSSRTPSAEPCRKPLAGHRYGWGQDWPSSPCSSFLVASSVLLRSVRS